ncbi:hypothetical protein GH714_033628 [Hevea brasiliensis]|uniref:K-box domain-containing protein n=1 Tax=Hevea brasiliensis TaxID=3981 RepID=A0A6A6MM15_HEVBR|nr:hypothetical protein GH714_033628 [Hevea brasiliensis]
MFKESESKKLEEKMVEVEESYGYPSLILVNSFSDLEQALKKQRWHVRATIERYKKANADSSNPASASEANTQFYQQESSKLRRQIREIQNLNRHILGEALGTLSLKELKNLESRLEKGISRIRSKKNEMLFAEIEYMQKREIELQNDNMFLRAKIAENERAQQQQQQQTNLMPSGSVYESVPSQQYDRNFFPVNLLEPNHHYSRPDHTALQLV